MLSFFSPRRVCVSATCRTWHRLLSTLPPAKNASNEPLVKLMQDYKLKEEGSEKPNGYKIRAFKQAIQVLSETEHTISSAEQAKELAGVGVGTAGRIAAFFAGTEYIEPNPIPKVKKQDNKLWSVLTELQRVPGVGSTTAKALIEAGCLTVSDMRRPEYEHLFTTKQKINLRYFEHLEKKASRDEAELVDKFIRDNISSKFTTLLCGSYRRGAESFSNITILLTHPVHVFIPMPEIVATGEDTLSNRRGRPAHPFHKDYTTQVDFALSPLKDVTDALQERGLIAATLNTTNRKWRGIVRIPENRANGEWTDRHERLENIESTQGVYRSLELNLAPMKSRGAASLALTGDIEFLRRVQRSAKDLGLLLNEFGLWQWQPSPIRSSSPQALKNGMKQGFWKLMPVVTEEEIMAALGMEYVKPEKRNFEYLLDYPRRAKYI